MTTKLERSRANNCLTTESTKLWCHCRRGRGTFPQQLIYESLFFSFFVSFILVENSKQIFIFSFTSEEKKYILENKKYSYSLEMKYKRKISEVSKKFQFKVFNTIKTKVYQKLIKINLVNWIIYLLFNSLVILWIAWTNIFIFVCFFGSSTFCRSLQNLQTFFFSAQTNFFVPNNKL